MRNWKTTSLGILTAVIAISTGAKAYLTTGQIPDLGMLAASLAAAWGLVAAKDGTARL